jgi:hypothetical protein
MKKKIEVLMKDIRLVGNAAFEKLQKSHQSAQTTLDKAKADKVAAKTAYRNVVEADKKNRERIAELHTAFLQAKYMRQYHRAAADLATYRLSQWLENWADKNPVLKSEKAKKAPKKVAQPSKAPAESAKPSKTKAAKKEVQASKAPAENAKASKAKTTKKVTPSKAPALKAKTGTPKSAKAPAKVVAKRSARPAAKS